MARVSYMRLKSPAGNDEAAAHAFDENRKLLPPGRWRIVMAGGSWVADVEDMPKHWQEQIQEWGEFGLRLREGDPDA